MPSLQQLNEMFSPQEVAQMNIELKEYMDSHKTLISVFGYDDVLKNATYEIYLKHGGN